MGNQNTNTVKSDTWGKSGGLWVLTVKHNRKQYQCYTVNKVHV